MKKFAIIVVICMLCFALGSCDPGQYSFDYEELIDSITSVELIQYDNSEIKRFKSWVPNHESRLSAFDFDKMEVLESLEEETIDDFLQELSEIVFLHKYYAYNSPENICIRMIFSNGDFVVLTSDYKNSSFCGYVGIFNSKGEVVDFVGCFQSLPDFEYLINEFFATQLT